MSTVILELLPVIIGIGILSIVAMSAIAICSAVASRIEDNTLFGEDAEGCSQEPNKA